jgi:putative acetyltransferase
MPPTIAIEDPDQPEVLALLAEADALYAGLYPADSNHLLDVAALRQPGVTVFVARIDGRAVGCGAVVAQDGGWAEIKRMYVVPAARGQRLGKALLDALEDHARKLGAGTARLETGVAQPEALRLYRAAGYVERGPFGAYAADPLSRFFEKTL